MSRLDKALEHCKQEAPKYKGMYVIGAGSLQQRFGITQEEYLQLLDKQGNKCGICRCNYDRASRFHVDHDHDTGLIRGLLCRKCNLGIGLLGDTLDTVSDAVAYLSACKPV